MRQSRINAPLWWVVGVLAGVVALVSAPAGKAPRAAAADPGEIRGKVFFRGTPPKLATVMMDQDPVCASEHSGPVHVEDGEVNANGTLPNVFVYVKSGFQDNHFTPPDEPVTLDQRGCMYVPHVLGVMAGQELRVLSTDPTTHNSHFLAKINRDWNQSQTPGAAPSVHRFTQPEIMIPVVCNQHPWMKAYVGVTSNPFYAVTGPDGSFAIKGLPAGTYTLAAWTATFGTQEQTVTVGSSGATNADFTIRSSE